MAEVRAGVAQRDWLAGIVGKGQVQRQLRIEMLVNAHAAQNRRRFVAGGIGLFVAVTGNLRNQKRSGKRQNNRSRGGNHRSLPPSPNCVRTHHAVCFLLPVPYWLFPAFFRLGLGFILLVAGARKSVGQRHSHRGDDVACHWGLSIRRRRNRQSALRDKLHGLPDGIRTVPFD